MSRGRATRHLNAVDEESHTGDGYSGWGKRRSRSAGGHRPTGRHRRSRRRDAASHAPSSTLSSGDASFVTHDTAGSTWRSSLRYDVDGDGYCLHHPDVELMRMRDDGDWRTIRKRCPDCMAEDCPPSPYSMEERSVREEYKYRHSEGRRRSRSRDEYDDDDDESRQQDSCSSSNNFDSAATSASVFGDLGMSFQTPEALEEEEFTLRLKRRLAARAYHFPGNTWCQDWMQYLSNTHTVLGLFFHHPLHPMGFQERLVILFGSIAIGLTISNFTYLYFIRNGISVDEEVLSLNARHTDITGIPVINITKLMITLWTLGSFMHTCFDLALWHMKACTLCRYQGAIDDRLVQWGRAIGLFIVMIACGAGGYVVILRASIEYKGEGSVADEVEESISNNEFYQIEFEDERSFGFLLGYLVEFVLALFVYYPIAVTVLFSGILGCGGRLPILGGRPREMKRERRYEMRKSRPKLLKGVNIETGPPGSGGGGGADDFSGARGDDSSYGSTSSFEDAYNGASASSYRDDESRSRFDESEII